MKALLTAVPLLLLALLAMPAYSSQCPLDIKKIGAALDAGPDMTPDQLAQVDELLAQGAAHHKAGAHSDEPGKRHNIEKRDRASTKIIHIICKPYCAPTESVHDEAVITG